MKVSRVSKRSPSLIKAQEAYEAKRHQTGDIKLALWIDKELKDAVQEYANDIHGGKLAPAIRELLCESLGVKK